MKMTIFLNFRRLRSPVLKEEQERFMIFSSLYWFSGILPIIMSTLYKVIRIYTPLPYEAGMAIDAFNKYKVNI